MMMTKKVEDQIERRAKKLRIKKGRKEKLEKEYTNILMMKHINQVLMKKRKMMNMQMLS